MAINVTITHGLGLDEARRRLEQEAARHGVEVRPAAVRDGVATGEVEHKTPMGPVAARYRATDAELEVEVVKKPAFVPEGMVRRALEEGLAKLLGPGA